ncbi:arginase [Anseongella ginsenosidimutans]|uniref:Arginase n=1 Tax=Anseongella ginsenosidimutans TaxID=496056 RepID=A0A4R3KRN2_9SPHI|nr:arginase [Anseongella ginsenosidimutans]QEC52946.1 arginase [Anseongella ginsenosidimutans]TCS87344.1 arginase [Anseongella ginsenosidimutans]
MHKLKLIEVRSEIGAGTRGASLGPDAIRIASLDFSSRFFKRYPCVSIPDENHLLFESSGDRYAKRISGILTMTERIGEEVCRTLEKGEFPIIVGGDHSIAAGTVAGIRMAFPKIRLGVIWIDAHADIHSPYTTPSGNMHGMPNAISLDEDNLESTLNAPDQETLNFWYQLKNVGGICPKITYENIVMIGVRDTEPAEDHLLEKRGIRNFSAKEIRRAGVEKVAVETLKYLDDCDLIHVSFDVDVLDPSVSRGTGTPVPNGITIKEARTLVIRLMQSKKIGTFELVEVNPTLDRENLMAEQAFDILLRASNQLTHNI